MSTSAKSKTFDLRLFDLVHEEITVDKLLGVLKLRFYDRVQSDHRNMFSLLNKGTKIVSRYIFLVEHYRLYLQNNFADDLEPKHSIFHIVDQHDEAKLELINSILLARAGMVNQAINTLRRAFESAMYGSFFSTSSIQIGNKTENPFVRLIEKGLWSSNAGNRAVRYSQIAPIIKAIRSRNHIPQKQAELRVLAGFTEYYLENICHAVCSDHYIRRKNIVCNLPNGAKKKCIKCDRTDANKALVEYPVTMGLMIPITDSRLRKKTDHHINLDKIYSNLSSYLHPNPESHQHEPAHRLDQLHEWLDFITNTVNVLTWLYIRCIQNIGYEEKSTTRLLESKKCQMNRVTLNQLSRILCKVLADQYQKYS